MLLGFMRQFHEAVREGSKTHTVRDRRKIRPKPGETCHCYGDVRQKSMFLLGRWPCTAVEEIVIHPLVQNLDGCRLVYGLRVVIECAELTAEEAEAFFYRDGFRDVPTCYTSTAMARDFWYKRLLTGPWTGDLIHWNFERPVPK